VCRGAWSSQVIFLPHSCSGWSRAPHLLRHHHIQTRSLHPRPHHHHHPRSPAPGRTPETLRTDATHQSILTQLPVRTCGHHYPTPRTYMWAPALPRPHAAQQLVDIRIQGAPYRVREHPVSLGELPRLDPRGPTAMEILVHPVADDLLHRARLLGHEESRAGKKMITRATASPAARDRARRRERAGSHNRIVIFNSNKQ